jgi:hypothetical protein
MRSSLGAGARAACVRALPALTRLPAYPRSGLLWFNCAKFSPSSAEGVRDVCPTADATWQVCAPMRANATTKALR